MAQKQRVSDMIGKALQKTNINFQTRRKLNFDILDEEINLSKKDLASCSSPHNISPREHRFGENINPKDVHVSKNGILQNNENSNLTPQSLIISDISNMSTLQNVLPGDTSIMNFILSNNYSVISPKSSHQSTAEIETISHQTVHKLPSDFQMISLPQTTALCIETEPLPSTSSSAVLQSRPFSKSDINSSTSVYKKKRSVKHNIQYFDYLSDEEDFTTIFGDAIDSDNYEPTSESSDSDKSMNNARKKIRKSKKYNKILGEPVQEIELNIVGANGKKHNRKNKKEERRILKQSGQAYTKLDGTYMPAKGMKPNPCIGKKCGNGCESITNEKRKSIFDYFWSLSTIRRKDWLVSMTQKTATKRKRTKDSVKRSYTYKYSITEGEGKRSVCLQFLAATLDVGLKFIQYTVQNSEIGLSREDNRGRREPHNKTKNSTITSLINFIKNLPAVSSHYCRKDSSRVYLPSYIKNVSHLYQIYKNSYTEDGIDVVSERIFRTTFNEKFNIGFHVPKKDKCVKCLKYEQSKDAPELKDEILQHEQEKQESYNRFKAHKNIHKNDPSTLCASFDLQKVLNTPFGDSMLLFYSRKLAVYNLCIYENGTRKVYCFYWDESNGKRGANEIATILNKYINIVDERGTVKNLLLYCDCCPGQNRNRIIIAMLHGTLQTCKNIEVIQINFLLTGHTYMPVDSVHAVIERNLKKTIIHAPSQWYTVFTTARQNPEPYIVELLHFNDFLKWDLISEKYFKGNLTGKISKMRIVTFRKNKESEITVKNSMSENAKSYNIEVLQKIKLPPPPCYKCQLPISKAKQNDLMKLCHDKVIPLMFHGEYNRLTSANNIKDTLPESDLEDGDDD